MESRKSGGALRRAMKWFAAGLCVLLAFAAAIAAAAWWYVQSLLAAPDIAQRASAALAELTGGEARIEKLTAGLTWGFDAERVTLSLPPGTAVSVDMVSARFNALSLLRGRLEVDGLRIIRPAIILTGAGGSGAGALEPPRSPVTVILREAVIEGLAVERRGGAAVTRLEGVDARIAGEIGPQGLSAEARVSTGKGAAAKFVNASGGKLTLALDGQTLLSLSPEGGAAITLDIASTVKEMEGVKGAPPGPFALSARGTASLWNAPEASAALTLDIKGGRALQADARWRQSADGGEFAVAVDKLALDLAEFAPLAGAAAEGRISGGPIRVSGAAAREGDITVEATGSAEAVIRRIEAPGIASARGVKASVVFDKFHARGGSYQGSVNARAAAAQIEAAGLALDKVDGEARLSVAGAGGAQLTTRARAADARYDNLDLGPVTLELSAGGDLARGNFDKLAGVIRTPGLELVRLRGTALSFGQENLEMEAKGSAPIQALGTMPVLRQAVERARGGAFRYRVNVEGVTGRDGKGPDVKLIAELELEDAAWTAPEHEIFADGVSALIEAEARVGAGWRPRQIRVAAKGSVENASVTGLAAHNAWFEAQGLSDNPASRVFEARVALEANRLEAQDIGRPQGPLRAEIAFSGDPPEGKYAVNRLEASLGGAASLTVDGEYDEKSRALSGRAEARAGDLRALFALVPIPARKKTGMESLTGGISMTARAQGSIPTALDQAAWPPPLTGEARFTARGAGGVFSGVAVKGVDAEVSLRSGEERGVSLAGGVWTQSVKGEALFGGVAVDPRVEFDLALPARGRVSVNRLVMEIPALGFIESLQGEAEGVSAAMIRKALEGKPAGLLGAARVSLENFTTLTLEKSQALLGDVTAEGAVESFVTLRLEPGERLALRGDAEFSELSARSGPVAVERASGKIPFSKTYQIVREKQATERPAAPTAAAPRDATFFGDVRAGAPRRSAVTMPRAAAGPVDLAGVVADLYFRETSFGADWLRASIWGGDLAGSARVTAAEEGHSLKTSLVFTGIDLARLGDGGNEASAIDGDVSLELSLAPGDAAEGVDIARIGAAAHLTRIGGKAVDRILAFLDPKESSPAVMNARTLLRYATPAKVDMEARHGNLSLTMDLKYNPLLGGRTVTMPVIKRLPLAGLANFGAIREKLRPLDAASGWLRLMAARQLVTMPDGAVEPR